MAGEIVGSPDTAIPMFEPEREADAKHASDDDTYHCIQFLSRLNGLRSRYGGISNKHIAAGEC
jgi:hypothetical protein